MGRKNQYTRCDRCVEWDRENLFCNAHSSPCKGSDWCPDFTSERMDKNILKTLKTAEEMRNLDLILKHQWYDLIDCGEKKEEYRDLSPYWIKRLCFTRIENPFVYCVAEKCCKECFDEAGENYCAYPFERVTFHRGYTSTTMTFEIESISIGTGKPEWGAEPDKEYFIIKLGKRL